MLAIPVPTYFRAPPTSAHPICLVLKVHTENVARGANWQLPECKGGQSVNNVLTFQKSRGARAHLGGRMPRPHPLNETLIVYILSIS